MPDERDIILHMPSSLLAQLGASANSAAQHYLFADERARRAPRTVMKHDDDLACFARYIRAAAGLPGPDPGPDGILPPNPLTTSAESWAGVTWGLLKAFAAWMLQEGYSMSSVNGRMATVRLYALWASQAGVIAPEELILIQGVKGYDRKAAYNIDQVREVSRVGAKKAVFRVISTDDAKRLKAQPNTPQGRRDAVLLGILIDHGLRCGELAMLRVEHFDAKRGTMTFYRPKIYRTQTHNLTGATKRAVAAYLREDAIMAGPLLLSSRKGGQLTHQGMTERAITARVADLGKLVGIPDLSAHDLRHSWATFAARNHTPLERLQDAGGWNSPDMPVRYIEAAKIANEGVKLGLDDD